MTDWLSRGKNQPFKDKRVGIMGASGGPVGTAQDKYDSDGTIKDEGTRKVIEFWLKAFEAWVRRG